MKTRDVYFQKIYIKSHHWYEHKFKTLYSPPPNVGACHMIVTMQCLPSFFTLSSNFLSYTEVVPNGIRYCADQFYLRLNNDTDNSSDYTTSNDRMNNELERIRREAVVT
jgi:hypothetical protein